MKRYFLTFRALATVFLFVALLAPRLVAATTGSISQYGIIWTFSEPVTFGQFINGDYWVIGPVTVTSVSPAPSVAPPDEVNDLGTNQWGDTGLQGNTTRRNGSMVVMTPGSSQGYDSRGVIAPLPRGGMSDVGWSREFWRTWKEKISEDVQRL